MTTTASGRPFGSTRLAWCLRAFSWLPVLGVFGLAAGAMLVFAQPSGYEASALVVTRQLDPNVKILPRYASSVFYNGAVARQVADQLGVADPSTVVPARLDVVTPEDSIVLTVVGKDPDPNAAARLADAGAAALVTQLNRGGPGVGTFEVEGRAAVPIQPAQQFPPLVTAVLGGLFGAVLGLSLIVLMTVLRRPVVAAEDVGGAVGTRLIGSLTLPRRTGGFSHPRDVRGAAAVARRMGDVPGGRFLVVSDPRDAELRRQAVVCLAVALAGLRPTKLLGDAHLDDEVGTLSDEPGHPLIPGGQPVVLIDQEEPLDTLRQADQPRVVVVARAGIPASSLRAAVAAHLRSELLGVVLVERQNRYGRRAQGARADEVPAEQVPV